jgi:hypothetical protein
MQNLLGGHIDMMFVSPDVRPLPRRSMTSSPQTSEATTRP